MLITDNDRLIEFCDRLRGAPYLAVDTEFMREKTYHARLCLVQVAWGEHAAAIDPLAPDLDFTPLKELLANESSVKVLHSAVQDLGIFLQGMGHVPGPVFDTQIAASVCGFGHQPGYAVLVDSMLGVKVDKASQAVDWSIRPLSDRQLEYALGDVTHLCQVYERLVSELDAQGRTAWVEEEMAALLDPDRYVTRPEEAYRRVKIRRPSSQQLAVLRELAAWRETQAMERDIPRGWLLRDEALAEIAQHLPKDAAALARVRGLKEHVARGADGRALLRTVAAALELPEEDWPVIKERGPAPGPGHDSLVALLQALLRLRADANGVATTMIANRADLERMAAEDEPDVEALGGWRRQIFGEAALDLKAGRLALTGSGDGAREVRPMDG
jgi:ribonuclease D